MMYRKKKNGWVAMPIIPTPKEFQNTLDMKAEGGLLEVGEGPAKGGRDNRRQWGVYG